MAGSVFEYYVGCCALLEVCLMISVHLISYMLGKSNIHVEGQFPLHIVPIILMGYV
jgi:hypothetical protein